MHLSHTEILRETVTRGEARSTPSSWLPTLCNRAAGLNPESSHLMKGVLRTWGGPDLAHPPRAKDTVQDAGGGSGVTWALLQPEQPQVQFQMDQGCMVAALRIQSKSKGLCPGRSSRVCNTASGAEGSSHPKGTLNRTPPGKPTCFLAKKLEK